MPRMPDVSGPAVAPPSAFQRFLSLVERAGNALPQPATLFALCAAIILVLSKILAAQGLSVAHPATGANVVVVDLLTIDGLKRMLLEAVPNLVNFPPLGTVLVCMTGLAVAEHTGLLSALLRLLVLNSSPRLLTPIVFTAAMLSHLASDIGYVLIIPLSAALYHAVGRHPLAGLTVAFAGVSGGFGANYLVGTLDVLLAGIATAAARVVDPTRVVTPLGNWYFNTASAVVLTAAGAWVAARVTAPRLGRYTGNAPAEPLVPLTPAERRGLRWAALTLVAITAVVLWGVLPMDGFLRDTSDAAKNTFFNSIFIRGLVAFIFLAGLLSGLAYGLGSGRVRSDRDIVGGMEKALSTMGSYLVLAFFAGQFIAYFNWTNLGVVLAVEGAQAIRASGLGAMPLMLLVVLFTLGADLVMGSASAKWALLAPILVPMFMLLGYSPEFTMAAYRVGDSCANIVSPLMFYFPLILSFARRYEPTTGLGTLMALMLPYTLVFLLVWTLLLGLFITLGLPLGPGAPLFLPAP